MSEIFLFHGSNKIINIPNLSAGKAFDDFGKGFYLALSEEMAGMWACTRKDNGYINKYSFEPEGLRIIDLNDDEYNILNWLSVILNNRMFRVTEKIETAYDYIKTQYLPVGIEKADVITGCRADDCTFSFIKAFLNNKITLQQLEVYSGYGKNSDQIVLKSEKAISHLSFLAYTTADKAIFYPKRKAHADISKKVYYAELDTVKQENEENKEKQIYIDEIISRELLKEDEGL